MRTVLGVIPLFPYCLRQGILFSTLYTRLPSPPASGNSPFNTSLLIIGALNLQMHTSTPSLEWVIIIWTHILIRVLQVIYTPRYFLRSLHILPLYSLLWWPESLDSSLWSFLCHGLLLCCVNIFCFFIM